jgi:hypothetical protein
MTKGRRSLIARSRCDRLWLVIVNDDVSGAAPAEPLRDTLETTYVGPFDRLLWLTPHVPHAIDLAITRIT